MATTPEQGIMALPQNQAMQAPQLSLMDSYDAMQQGLQNARPDASMELEEALAEIRGELEELTDEQLAQLIEAVQGLYGDPQNYAKEVADMVQEGLIDADDLPPEYDEEFLAALLMVLVDTQRSRMATAGSEQPLPEAPMGMAPMGMMPPQGFARGGIAEAAQMVASRGRRGDTMLAHITPSEARMLKARGGSGTINPETGLPEFFIKKIFKAIGKTFKRVGKAVKKALSSPIGRVIGTIALGMVLGPAVATMFPSMAAVGGGLTAMGSAVTGALASGSVAALSGGDLKSILTSAATGFMGAPGGPVSNFIGKYTGQFLTNPVVREAATGAIIGTGTGLLTGQNLRDSIKNGLTEGAISGGMALMSGAPKVDADAAAKNAAAEAAVAGPRLPQLDADSASPDFRGAGAQRRTALIDLPETSRTSVQNPDGTITVTGRNAQGGITSTEIRSPSGELLSTSKPTISPEVGIAQRGAAYPGAEAAKVGIFAAENIPISDAPSMFPSPFPGTTPKPNMDEAIRAQLAGSQVADLGTSYYDRPPVPTTGTGISTSQTIAAPGAYRPGGPTVGESFSTMGSGAKKFLSGDFSAGASEFAQGASDLLAPGPSREQIVDYAQKNNISITEAEKALSPGFLRTYGPAAATGIGALALAGGFTPQQTETPDRGPTGEDLLRQDPNRYLVQGLPGVQYGAQGNIMSSQPYSSPYTMANIRVPSAYSYPAMFAQGGIAALAQGGYPRRVGQISGPGTEKSDSIPAMLSDGEFVMTAKAVRGAGGGSRREGAKRMYALMHQLERNAARG